MLDGLDSAKKPFHATVPLISVCASFSTDGSGLFLFCNMLFVFFVFVFGHISSVADPDPGSGGLFNPWILDGKIQIRDLGLTPRIRDKHPGSSIASTLHLNDEISIVQKTVQYVVLDIAP
jgi:hypothetical protein